MMRRLLSLLSCQSICLKSNYNLRKQIFLSYAIISCIFTSIIAILACYVAVYAGSNIKSNTNTILIKEQVNKNILDSCRYTADVINERLVAQRSLVSFFHEVVRDRIVGYPNDGWENDTHIPFQDMLSGKNIYPIRGIIPPLDWNITVYDNKDLEAYLHERVDYFVTTGVNMSKEAGVLNLQGACNPSVKDPSELGYYINCTDANNDIRTGGVVKPVNTTQHLVQKIADLRGFFKAIFETDPEIGQLQMNFVNGGAGFTMTLPSHMRNHASKYNSSGCDWMREINKATGKPFATEKEISRCNPKGTIVFIRDYNPLERGFFSYIALNPGKPVIYGPFS